MLKECDWQEGKDKRNIGKNAFALSAEFSGHIDKLRFVQARIHPAVKTTSIISSSLTTPPVIEV